MIIKGFGSFYQKNQILYDAYVWALLLLNSNTLSVEMPRAQFTDFSVGLIYQSGFNMASSRAQNVIELDAIIRIEAGGVAVKVKDLEQGMRFGTLTAIEPAGYIIHGKKKKHRYLMWKFSCDCGNIKEIIIYNVLSGQVKSCGNNCAAASKRRMELKPHILMVVRFLLKLCRQAI